MVISIDSCSSNSWENYWMSFLQLVFYLYKTKPGINSILPIVSFWLVLQQESVKQVQILSQHQANTDINP